MSSMDQISTDLKLLKSKREKLLKTLQNNQSYPSVTLQWKEFEELSLSINSLMQTCFRELESKGKEIDDRVKEVEARENELKLCVKDMGLSLIDFSTGERLSLLLNDHENELEKMADGVHNILKMSSDPAKLVLDAITKRLDAMKKGFCLKIETSIVKRSTVILLEQLIKVGPMISKRLRKRAVKLAKEWKSMMEEKGEDDVEILGFLMLLGAYELVDEFDLNELRSLLESVAQHKQAPELRHVLGLVDKSPGSSPSQVQIKQAPLEKKQVKPERYVASSPLSCWPELKSFCVSMNGRGLVLFLCQREKDHDSMRRALSEALELASDPAKLVLGVLPGFYPSNNLFKGLPLQNVRRSCILLLEQLMTFSPQIEPCVNEKALKLAVDWKKRVSQKYTVAATNYGFLLFIVTYKLVSTFDASDLLGFLVRASEHKRSPNLCLALGLADKIAIPIKNLLNKALMLEAIEYICAFELFQEFPPRCILNGYLNYQKKKIYKISNLPQNEAIDREIATVRAVIKCINDHRLESNCPPKKFEKQIVKLEKRKTDNKSTARKEEKKAEGKQTYESIPSQVKMEQAPLEKKQTTVEQYKASSPVSCWPELKSFCISMDGRGLVLFLCQHVEDHDSMRRAISDALGLTSDPAKLVLDVLPGFHCSKKYFKGLPLQNVKRSCILLLEQLMAISPQIEPCLNEEALKLAVDWKTKVAKHPTFVAAYGLLLFIVTYKLVSTSDAYELLDLLVRVRASEHKQSPDLSLPLGLADKIPRKTGNWIKHYGSGHKILLVGEGDFSFALCLAKAFGSAANMIATSLDSRDEVITKYSKGTPNLKELEELGCTILHRVDARTMSQHGLLCPKFLDRIVFNFPHAGFVLREIDSLQIKLHQKVVKGFLRSAKDLLKENGEIHITHKTAHPFNLWAIEKLAEEVGLCLVGKARFCIQDYPGYSNKRGDGIGCDNPFPVGQSTTFKFAKPLFSALFSTVNPS